MNDYYVYVYLDIRKPGNYSYEEFSFEYEPFYIGKGKNNRYLRHITISKQKDSNGYIHRKIRKILLETSLEPVVLKLQENLSEDDALKLEIRLIKLIGRDDISNGTLVNRTDGGDGLKNASIETRHKMSENMHRFMRNPENKKKIYTKERATKISNALSGRKHSIEHISKLPQNQKGYKHTEEFKNKLSVAASGEKNPMFGKSMYDVWIQKYGKELADIKLNDYKKKQAAWQIGEKSRFFNTNVYEMWLEKYGKDEADKRQELHRERQSLSSKGKPKSEEWKRKASSAAKKRWERQRKEKLNIEEKNDA